MPSRSTGLPRPCDIDPGLGVRGYRSGGLPQVDLFWTGSRKETFDVYRDGRRIATVSASGYTDRPTGNESGSYRYRVCATGTESRSNEAVVTFAGARNRDPHPQEVVR